MYPLCYEYQRKHRFAEQSLFMTWEELQDQTFSKRYNSEWTLFIEGIPDIPGKVSDKGVTFSLSSMNEEGLPIKKQKPKRHPSKKQKPKQTFFEPLAGSQSGMFMSLLTKSLHAKRHTAMTLGLSLTCVPFTRLTNTFCPLLQLENMTLVQTV